MFCDICKKNGLVQYRVVNGQQKLWIFNCKNCLQEFTKTEGYTYIYTEELGKQIVEVKNNYQLKLLL